MTKIKFRLPQKRYWNEMKQLYLLAEMTTKIVALSLDRAYRGSTAYADYQGIRSVQYVLWNYGIPFGCGCRV